MKASHPLGKSPVITDGTIVVAESGAIIEYLTCKYADGRLAITDPNAPEFADYLHWLHYAEGSAVTPLLFELYLRLLGGGRGADHAAAQLFSYIEGAPKQRSFFVGSRFTAADIHCELRRYGVRSTRAVRSQTVRQRN